MSGALGSFSALRARPGLHLLAALAVALAAALNSVEQLTHAHGQGRGTAFHSNGLAVAVCCLTAAGIVARDTWRQSFVSRGSLWMAQLTRLLVLSVIQLGLAQLVGLCVTGDLTFVSGQLLGIALPAVLASALALALLRLQLRWRVGALLLLVGSLVLPALPRFELEPFNVAARAFDFLAPLRWLAKSSDTWRVASCYVATVSGLLGLAWLLPRSIAP